MSGDSFSPRDYARQCAQALFQSRKIKGCDIQEVTEQIERWMDRVVSSAERSPNFIIAHNSPIFQDELLDQWGRDCDEGGFEWVICAGSLNHKSEGGDIWECMKALRHDVPVSIEYDYASSTVRYENVDTGQD